VCNCIGLRSDAYLLCDISFYYFVNEVAACLPDCDFLDGLLRDCTNQVKNLDQLTLVLI
jgi:hypothetical protein